MAVDTQKFLPFAKTSSSIMKYAGASGEEQKFDTENQTQEKISIIKTKVIDADKLLEGTLALEKKELNAKKRAERKVERAEEEKRLEKKPDKKEKDKKMPSIPGMGIFGWIKNFIGKTILGYFVYRLIDHLPKLIEFVKFIGPATDFLIDLGGKLLNGLVTFVDWGYKAYDATKGFMKNLFGDDGAKKFDQLAGLLNQFLNLALIVGMATSGPGIGGKPGKGLTGIKGARGVAGRSRYGASADAARRYAQRFGRDAAVRRFGEQGVRSLGGKYARSGITNLARKGVVGALGKQGTRTALKLVKPLVRNVPLIGGIMEFVLSWMSGDPVGKAAFRGVGAGLGTWAGGALGTLMGPGIGTAIGMWVGSQGGAALGGLLYDAIFKGKEPKEGSGNVEGRAEGGQVTRGGQRVSGARRTLKRRKKITRIKPQEPTKEKVEVPSKLKSSFLGIDKTDPQIEKTAKVGTELGKTDYFGPILAATSKVLLGEELKQKDYQNVGRGINLLIADGFNTEQLSGGVLAAFANGGMVDKELLETAGNVEITNWVAKTFKKSIETELQKSLELIGETQAKREKETPQSTLTPDSLESGPAGTSGDALTMARNLIRDLGLTEAQASGIVGNMIAESGVENARPQNTPPGTKGPLVVDGVTGYGIVQWTDRGRQQKLYEFAKSKGHDMSKPLTMDIEYQFFLKEFREDYGNVLHQIKKAKDVKTASKIFMQQYETPEGYRTNAKIMERYKLSQPVYEKLSAGQGRATEDKGTYVSTNDFNIVQYVTGDKTYRGDGRQFYYDLDGHGRTSNYHDHIAFRTIEDKERAKAKLRAAGIKLGNEYRAGDPGYHGKNLAIDVPGGQWGGSGAIGNVEYEGSKKVRKILGLYEGGIVPRAKSKQNMEVSKNKNEKYNNSLLKNYASYESGSEESITVIIPNQMQASISSYGGRSRMIPVPIVVGSGGDPYEFLDYQG